MRRIKRVDSLDSGFIDITFMNGSAVLFDLNVLSDRPEISALLKTEEWIKPQTDGAAISWKDGTRIILEDILSHLDEKAPDKGES
jgi:hypothetical protein